MDLICRAKFAVPSCLDHPFLHSPTKHNEIFRESRLLLVGVTINKPTNLTFATVDTSNMLFKTGFMAILAAGSAMAHMNMNDPAPLTYKGNPNTQEANTDYSITSPITAAQYPCKNTLKLLGTADATAVTTYSPGQQATMTVEGGAPHNGGSCQLSLSYDKGTTFTVIKSFHGGCPLSSGQKFDFTIPSDAPEGDDVVFAWTWVNKTGNREYYMSCAVVNIKAGGRSALSSLTRSVPPSPSPIARRSSRPTLVVNTVL